MKILIVNFSDIEGGASRASYRLHQALKNAKIDSKMLVQNKKSDDYTVIEVSSSPLRKIYYQFLRSIERLWLFIIFQERNIPLASALFSSKDVVKTINIINPDIVHLHWINAGMLSIEDIEKIKAPIVWSLHDMWAFTGGCHYTEECTNYEKECGSCKFLRKNKQNDLSKKIYNRKQKVFSNISRMTIVGLSKWMKECSKNSSLLKSKKHINLPNPIDTNIFKPFDKEKARELWGLPKEKKLILFGAMGATSNSRKGFKELSKALKKSTDKDIELVIFGSSEPKESQNFKFKTHYVGYIYDDISLVTLYNAVDVMIVPSLQENLSNAIMESLACGTPVVGFAIGGNSDMIVHKMTGYLAKPFDISDLSNGIEWVLKNKEYSKLCQNAREKVLESFDSKLVAKKYINLYNDILQIKDIR